MDNDKANDFNKEDKLRKFKSLIENYSKKQGRSVLAIMGQIGIKVSDNAKQTDKL